MIKKLIFLQVFTDKKNPWTLQLNDNFTVFFSAVIALILMKESGLDELAHDLLISKFVWQMYIQPNNLPLPFPLAWHYFNHV